MHLDVILFGHEGNVFKLGRTHDEAQTLTCRGDTRSPANSVHILFHLAGEVKLDDPVDSFEVKAPRRDVCAYE